jgi:magnesium chelatase family protein
VQHYLQRISGPLLDRLNIHIEVPALSTGMLGRPQGEPFTVIREREIHAWQIQQEQRSVMVVRGRRRHIEQAMS